MSIFTKSQKKASSRRQIAIEGVRDDILLLPHSEYRAVLQVSALNFELKSEAEQDALIDTYQSFLNSLPGSLQILVRVRELDMDKYLVSFSERSQLEDEGIYKQQAQHYIQFVSKLVTSSKILTRHFYVVISLSGEPDFTLVREQVTQTVDIVAKGLARMGMQTRRLGSLELLDLFYTFYSPADAKRQPLSEQTLKMLQEQYV